MSLNLRDNRRAVAADRFGLSDSDKAARVGRLVHAEKAEVGQGSEASGFQARHDVVVAGGGDPDQAATRTLTSRFRMTASH
jgi:hypothetical protein